MPLVQRVPSARRSSEASSTGAHYYGARRGYKVIFRDRVASPTRLVEKKTGYLDRGKHLVPLSRNVLVGNLDVALLAGHEGLSGGKEKTLLIPQDDLVKGVMEL